MLGSLCHGKKWDVSCYLAPTAMNGDSLQTETAVSWKNPQVPFAAPTAAL